MILQQLHRNFAVVSVVVLLVGNFHKEEEMFVLNLEYLLNSALYYYLID